MQLLACVSEAAGLGQDGSQGYRCAETNDLLWAARNLTTQGPDPQPDGGETVMRTARYLAPAAIVIAHSSTTAEVVCRHLQVPPPPIASLGCQVVHLRNCRDPHAQSCSQSTACVAPTALSLFTPRNPRITTGGTILGREVQEVH